MNPRETFRLRTANLQDAPVIATHRRSMCRDMGYGDQAALDRMAASFLPWVRAKIQASEYLTWFAVAGDDAVVAGAGLWLMDWPPHMVGSGSRRGNILNVYTEPEFRRLGLARRLTEAAIEWCGSNGVDCVILHASAEGRALYEALGFRATNEMRRIL